MLSVQDELIMGVVIDAPSFKVVSASGKSQ